MKTTIIINWIEHDIVLTEEQIKEITWANSKKSNERMWTRLLRLFSELILLSFLKMKKTWIFLLWFLLIVCAILVIAVSSLQWSASVHRQALNNIIVSQYIDERLDLQSALSMIETGKANKLVACEKIPSEVRTQQEVLICWK